MTQTWQPTYPDAALPAGHQLFDVEADPQQTALLHDREVEERLTAQMVELMRYYDAPAEQFTRMGL